MTFRLTEILNESAASDEAKKKGLEYYNFGRYGKKGVVTHTIDKSTGKLVAKKKNPADQRPVSRPKTKAPVNPADDEHGEYTDAPSTAMIHKLKPQDKKAAHDPKDPFGSMNLFDKPTQKKASSKTAPVAPYVDNGEFPLSPEDIKLDMQAAQQPELAPEEYVARLDNLGFSKLERNLLLSLAGNVGRTVTRGYLLEKVWNAAPDIQTRTVDMHISRLKKKLKAAGVTIHSVRGYGYRLGSFLSRLDTNSITTESFMPILMTRLIEVGGSFLPESDASEEAAKMGLEYYKFGRYGKGGKVTHTTDQSGKLVPVAQQGATGGAPSPTAKNPAQGFDRNDGETPETRADRDSRLQSKPTMGLNPNDPYGAPLAPKAPGTPPETTVAGPRQGAAPSPKQDKMPASIGKWKNGEWFHDDEGRPWQVDIQPGDKPGTYNVWGVDRDGNENMLAADQDFVSQTMYNPNNYKKTANPVDKTGTIQNQPPVGTPEFWAAVDRDEVPASTIDGHKNGKFVTLSDGRSAVLELRPADSGNPNNADVYAVDSDGEEYEWDADVPLEGAPENDPTASGSEFGDDAEMASRGVSPYGPDEGMSVPMFREMVRQTEEKFGLKESAKSKMNKLVKEEYVKILDEAKKNAPKISKKLHEFREELFKSMLKRETSLKNYSATPALQRRIQLNTVSEAIEVPVNELMLYFINNVKHNDEQHHLIEYRLGCVTFYSN